MAVTRHDVLNFFNFCHLGLEFCIYDSDVFICLSQGCAGCKSPASVRHAAAPFDVEINEMELCSILNTPKEGATKVKESSSEVAMDEQPLEEEDDDDEEDEGEEEEGKTQESGQAAAADELRATSGAAEGTARPPQSDMNH